MRLLQASKCCFCANLRTGGLIIGYIYLILSILHAPAVGKFGILTCLIGVIVHCAWLYGIYRKQPKFMIPGVCLALFGLCVLLLFLILIPILGAVFSDDIKKALEKDAEDRHQEQTASVLALLIVSWFLFAICAVIEWHVSCVMYTLFKTMKDGERPNAMYGA